MPFFFLLIFITIPAHAQQVPGKVIFHPQPETAPKVVTPFRKELKPEPEEKIRMPKTNAPIVPGGDLLEEKPEPKPIRRKPASMRRPVEPPEDLLPKAEPAPKKEEASGKPRSLIASSPMMFSESPIAIYQWHEVEEYFEDTPIIRFTAQMIRREELVQENQLTSSDLDDNSAIVTLFEKAKHTEIPLRYTHHSYDMLFLDDEGLIVQFVYKTEPGSARIVESNDEIRSVVQLPAGSIKKHALEIGDKVGIF